MMVMILEEPDDEIVIDVSTDEKLESVALAIVTSRFNEGYYKEPVEPKKPEMSSRDVNKLKDERLKEFGQTLHKNYRTEKAEYDRRYREWQAIKDCIDKQDGAFAVKVLDSRKNQQRENVYYKDVRDSY